MYPLEQYYQKYLEGKPGVSTSSVNHYLGAMNTVTLYLKRIGLVSESVYEISELSALLKCRDSLYADAGFVEKNLRGHHMYSVALNHYVDFAEGNGIETRAVNISIMDTPVERRARTSERTTKPWSRSGIVRDQAIISAGYLCEVDQTHTTFLSAATGKQYMEGHHLLAMRHQDKFVYSLDTYANIVCLCPTCHKCLHHAVDEVRKPVLKKLYQLRKNRLANSGIMIGEDEFLAMAIER